MKIKKTIMHKIYSPRYFTLFEGGKSRTETSDETNNGCVVEYLIMFIVFLSPSCILKRTGWRMSLQVVAMWERFHLAFYRTSESKWPCIGIKNQYKDKFSANGWKDQNMDFSFSSQRKPYMEKPLFDWPIVLQYDVKVKYRLISRKFWGMTFFYPSVRLANQKPCAFVSVR